MTQGHLEPLTALIRVGGAYGHPYTWAATVRYVSPEEVELMGATRAPTPRESDAVKDVLRAAGIRVLIVKRMRGDRPVVRRYQL